MRSLQARVRALQRILAPELAVVRLPSFMAAHKYLERCRVNNYLPDSEDLLHALIPWARRYPATAF